MGHLNHFAALRRVLLCGVLTASALCCMHAPPPGPMESAESYCVVDNRGGRLEVTRDDRRYTDFVATEPTWDKLTVISDFQILEEKTDKMRAVVLVGYDVVGFLNGETWRPALTPKEQRQLIEFKLHIKNGHWRITGPVIEPHVSAKAAVKHLDGLIAEDKAQGRIRPDLLKAREAIQAIVDKH